MYRNLLYSIILLFASTAVLAQSDEDALFIRKIYDEALSNGHCYQRLAYLSDTIGGRLSGSAQAELAVRYTEKLMKEDVGMDKVWLQACEVPRWVRGKIEEAHMVTPDGKHIPMATVSLGNSPATAAAGTQAPVVEVHSLKEVEELGEAIKGKIVFYNRPMDPKQIRTFSAYGGAVDQRGSGPALAAKYGAVAAIVRSMRLRTDRVPHTGVTIFKEGEPQIPALAISTLDADQLSKRLKSEPATQVFVRNNCQMLPNVTSHNVIGEWRGSSNASELILVGGHLDSWDVGGGAHDDGAGCMHAIEAIRILKVLGYEPNRSLRCVMFMNEENGLAGAREYARVSNEKKEFHLAAIESDAGGFSPRAFSLDGSPASIKERSQKISKHLPLIEPYGLTLTRGGSGSDINPLKSQGGLLLGLRPDSQRYFDYHHNADDTISAVNQRELELGAAALATMIYLIDKYGL